MSTPRLFGVLGLLMMSHLLSAQAPDSQVLRLYLMPGLAADGRSFDYLDLDPRWEVHVIEHLLPEQGERMPAYARRMATAIDTTQPFALLGVSLGGMIATEMSTFLQPETVIIVASVKGRRELPWRYRLLRTLPLYYLTSGRLMQRATHRIRPWFEPEGRPFNDLSTAMLDAKDPRYMPRAVHLIMTWPRMDPVPGIVHIHGEKDHTLPARRVRDAIILPDGSHMAIMTRAGEISAIVNAVLAGQPLP